MNTRDIHTLKKPTPDQRLRALLVKMKCDADDRLFEAATVSFDTLHELETAVGRLLERITIAEANAIRAEHSRQEYTRMFEIEAKACRVAEKKLQSIRLALGIEAPTNRACWHP